MELKNILFETLLTITVAFITSKITSNNERKKQATDYFKKEGTTQQKELLEFWCSILIIGYINHFNEYVEKNIDRLKNIYKVESPKQLTDTQILQLVQRDSYMYSSKKTIKYIGKYMQAIFRNSNKKRTTKINIEEMVLVGKVISNMKFDFTNEKISIINLLKLKINDLDFKKRIQIFWYDKIIYLF